MHDEARRLYVVLFAHILADLDKGIAAMAAGAGGRFVPVFGGRCAVPACGLLRRAFSGNLGGLLLDFRFHGGQIGVPAFLEQLTLLWREGFALVGETQGLVVRQLQRVRSDIDVGSLNAAASRKLRWASRSIRSLSCWTSSESCRAFSRAAHKRCTKSG